MEAAGSMDALADVLKTIRLNAQTYFCSDFVSPWGMEIAHSPEGLFHVAVKGQCWLMLPQAEHPLLLEEGDIVAFPTGGAHSICDAKDSPRLPGHHVVENILDGNNLFNPEHHAATSHTLLCGSFSYDSSVKHPFLIDLPCFIHIKAKENQSMDWLTSLVDVLANETRVSSPGSTLMVDRLTEILFIQLIRAYIKQSPQNLNYMAALADPQIGSALNLIHAETQAYWTVERLGNAVALSRTAFTEKFSKLVGMAPKTYLLNGRMRKAKALLENSELSMYDIAERTGYSSEAAFSKAFKLFFNKTPGQARREPHS